MRRWQRHSAGLIVPTAARADPAGAECSASCSKAGRLLFRLGHPPCPHRKNTICKIITCHTFSKCCCLKSSELILWNNLVTWANAPHGSHVSKVKCVTQVRRVHGVGALCHRQCICRRHSAEEDCKGAFVYCMRTPDRVILFHMTLRVKVLSISLCSACLDKISTFFPEKTHRIRWVNTP